MNNDGQGTLKEAISVAEMLPVVQQELLAAEIFARVDELTRDHLTPEQQSEVARQLAEPARYADPEAIKAFFARHGVTV